jgi:hypothetical protein
VESRRQTRKTRKGRVYLNRLVDVNCHRCRARGTILKFSRIQIKNVENMKDGFVYLCPDCSVEWGLIFRARADATLKGWSEAWSTFMSDKPREVVQFT